MGFPRTRTRVVRDFEGVARQTCWRSGWWVRVDVPDGTPEYTFDDGTQFAGNFHLAIEMVNALELEFERGD